MTEQFAEIRSLFHGRYTIWKVASSLALDVCLKRMALGLHYVEEIFDELLKAEDHLFFGCEGIVLFDQLL